MIQFGEKLTLTSPTTLEWHGRTYAYQTGRGGIALSRRDLIEILGEMTPVTQLVVPTHLDQAISPLLSSPLQENLL